MTSKIHDIFEGTEQIQQLVISRAISGQRQVNRRVGAWLLGTFGVEARQPARRRGR